MGRHLEGVLDPVPLRTAARLGAQHRLQGGQPVRGPTLVHPQDPGPRRQPQLGGRPLGLAEHRVGLAQVAVAAVAEGDRDQAAGPDRRVGGDAGRGPAEPDGTVEVVPVARRPRPQLERLPGLVGGHRSHRVRVGAVQVAAGHPHPAPLEPQPSAVLQLDRLVEQPFGTGQVEPAQGDVGGVPQPLGRHRQVAALAGVPGQLERRRVRSRPQHVGGAPVQPGPPRQRWRRPRPRAGPARAGTPATLPARQGTPAGRPRRAAPARPSARPRAPLPAGRGRSWRRGRRPRGGSPRRGRYAAADWSPTRAATLGSRRDRRRRRGRAR